VAVRGNICVGDLEVCPHERAVLVRGEDVPFTSREFDLIARLAEHPGWVFSAGQLSGDSETGDRSPESISVLVSRVRQKLACAGALDVIETVRGSGYRLHAQGAAAGDERTESGEDDHELRDATWRLQEAVMEVEHSGTESQQRAAVEVLEQARHAIYGSLAE
jgi:DNA-binding winged helix-turn-helix (wHTH) protein